MASLKYFLKDPDSKKESLINLVFQYGYYEIDQKSGRKKYKFLKMSSGEKINPKFWNPIKCRARESRAFSQGPEFNARLEDLESQVLKVYRKIMNEGNFPTPTKLKQEIQAISINQTFDRVGKNDQIGFFDFIDSIINDSYNGVRLTPNGKQFSIHTVKGYVTSRNHLENFQRFIGERIEFDSIDMDFYNSFINWFYDQDMAKNTVGKHIKNLKVFMSEAFDHGISKNLDYRKKRFKTLSEATDSIYLSDEELERMLALDLNNKPNLERVRDHFLLDCYIGLRFADFNNLKENHIVEVQGIKMIRIAMQKTEHPVMIPLKKNAINILEKYDYQINAFTNQAMNRLIKEVGKLAEIDEEISSTITKGGKRLTTINVKYEKITYHTARRSFATNLYLANVPVLAIMKMTGHKTERSFLKYIRITPEENALNIAAHPYFSE